MIPSSAFKLAWIIGTAALAVITVTNSRPRNGWCSARDLDARPLRGLFLPHSLVCSLYRRPFLVAIALMLLAGLLEALQGLTIDRTPDLLSALCGAGGVLTAALVASLVMGVQQGSTPSIEAIDVCDELPRSSSDPTRRKGSFC